MVSRAGDVYFLRRLTLAIVILMMLFLPLCVKGFLSRPIPYRPLTKEQRKFPCDPNDVKRESRSQWQRRSATANGTGPDHSSLTEIGASTVSTISFPISKVLNYTWKSI